MIALPRSTFYYQSVLQTEIGNDKQALELIEAVQDEFPGYGYQRITHTLRTQGDVINHKRIARIMKEHRLSVRRRRRRPYFTSTEDGLAAFPNLYCNLIPSQPNKVWIADITFIRITTGFAYLAVILDAWSRKVIGYAISQQIDTDLTLAALKAAVQSRQPVPNTCIHLSDQGSPYGSRRYRQALQQYGLIGSMSAVANPYDHAQAESFMKTLKGEEVIWRATRLSPISPLVCPILLSMFTMPSVCTPRLDISLQTNSRINSLSRRLKFCNLLRPGPGGHSSLSGSV